MKINKQFAGKFISLLIATMLMQCVAENKVEDKPGDSSPSVVLPILIYAHSSDYSTYKLDYLYENGTLNTGVVSLSTSGIRSPQFYENKLIFVSSKSGGTLEIYDPADYSSALASVNLDDVDTSITGEYPHEFVIVNKKAYVALQGPYGTNQTKVAIVDLSNLASPSISGTITVGNQPTNVRYNGTYIYVTNQDWNDKSQATVSVINPATDSVIATINVGENPSDLAFASNYKWTYDSKWFGGTSASMTAIDGSNATTTVTSFPSGYSPASGGKLAFTNGTGYVLLSNNPGSYPPDLYLFSFADNLTSPNFTGVDTTNKYKYIGTGASGYYYTVHNGDGSNSVMTMAVTSPNGTNVGTYSLTKDNDMSFWPQK